MIFCTEQKRNDAINLIRMGKKIINDHSTI